MSILSLDRGHRYVHDWSAISCCGVEDKSANPQVNNIPSFILHTAVLVLPYGEGKLLDYIAFLPVLRRSQVYRYLK